MSMATSAYACFDLAIVLPTLLCTPGEVFVLVGLVLVSHAMCFVCECVRAQFSSLHVLWLVLLCFEHIQRFIL